MNKYIAVLKDKRRGSLDGALLNAHVEHLKEVKKNGRLYLCGPFEDNDGAMQILLANTYEEAKEILLSDPFIKNKYYQNYDLFSLIEANDDNNYLLEDTQTKINLKK